MNELLKIFIEIINRLAQENTVQQHIIAAVQSMLHRLWHTQPKQMAAELSSGEITELTEDLRSTLKQHAKEVDAVVEVCHQIQKMFNISGITEFTVNEAKIAIRNVNAININVTLNIEDPRKLKDVNLNPLRLIASAFSKLLRKLDNLNNINPVQDQLTSIKEEDSALLHEVPKIFSAIDDIITILFLSADPIDITSGKLRLSKEVKEIEEALIHSKWRDKFVLLNKGAVELEDIPKYILINNPSIVHISAHGASGGELILESEAGESVRIRTEALESIFRVHSEGIHLVIFNACQSANQAQVVNKYIDYAIGMKEDISDDAAIAFSVGFYVAFGAGKGVETAFDNGCLQIQLKKLEEQYIPTLFAKGDLGSKRTESRHKAPTAV